MANFSILTLFKHIKSKFALPKDKVQIDNWWFKLHYMTTMGLFLLFAVIITAECIIWNPITCFTDNKALEKAIESYCWVTSTYTLKGLTSEIYPGIGPEDNIRNMRTGDRYRYNNPSRDYKLYYQWVALVLAFNGVIYMIPRAYWKMFESKLMFILTTPIRIPKFVFKKKDIKKLIYLAKYLILSKGSHTLYGLHYYLALILNLVIVIGSIINLNLFLGSSYMSYGFDIFNYYAINHGIGKGDPIINLFPRMGKCEFFKYGPSGSIEKHDSLCILSQNIINDKIFLFLWYYLPALFVLDVLYLTYKFIEIISMKFRKHELKKIYGKKHYKRLIVDYPNLSYGDFIALSFIRRNVPKATIDKVITLMEIMRVYGAEEEVEEGQKPWTYS